jgi:hypothetical protein
MPITVSAEEAQTASDSDFKGMTFSTDKSAPMWKMPHTLTELPYTIETWFTMPTTVTSGRGGTIFSSYIGSGNNTTIEKLTISARDKDAYNFEVFIDNQSIASSFGIFRDNSTYDISINDEVVKSVTYNNKTFDDCNFTYGDHEIRVEFVDRNNTSIKQFVRSDQGNFLNLYLE